jgi:hypothetical protein
VSSLVFTNSICANIRYLGWAIYYHASCIKVLEPHTCIEHELIWTILITRLYYELIPSSRCITSNYFSLLTLNDAFTLVNYIIGNVSNGFDGRIFQWCFWLNFIVLSCYLPCLAKKWFFRRVVIFSENVQAKGYSNNSGEMRGDSHSYWHDISLYN